MRTSDLEKRAPWRERAILGIIVACTAVTGGVVPAEAALTTPKCLADFYWSSTSAGSATSANAWFMDFAFQRESFDGKTFLAFARAVRRADL